MPFDFLEQEDVLASTIRFYLESMRERFDQEYGDRNVRLVVDLDGVSSFLAREYGKDIREFGGRAVINTLQTVVLPELARRLLELETRPPHAPVALRLAVVASGASRICERAGLTPAERNWARFTAENPGVPQQSAAPTASPSAVTRTKPSPSVHS